MQLLLVGVVWMRNLLEMKNRYSKPVKSWLFLSIFHVHLVMMACLAMEVLLKCFVQPIELVAVRGFLSDCCITTFFEIVLFRQVIALVISY